MANEFVARNGLIAQNNSVITGSLVITGSTTVRGDTIMTGSLIVSGSGVTQLLVGSSSLFVSSSRNVGIGTLTPSYPLEIAGGSNLIPMTVTATGNDMGIMSANIGTLALNRTSQVRLVNGTTYFGANDRTYQLVNIGTSTTAADFYLQYWNGSTYLDRFRITSDGNVGIGAATLTAKLQVRGTGATSATNTLLLQNSSLTNLFTVKDDGTTTISGSLTVTGNITGTPSIGLTQAISVGLQNIF